MRTQSGGGCYWDNYHLPVSVLEVWDPPRLFLWWCHCCQGNTVPKRSQTQQGSKAAACSVTISPHVFLLEMPSPISPTILSLCHRPVPFPWELTAICALRITPSFSAPLIIGSCSRSSITFSYSRPTPNKCTLIHTVLYQYDHMEES